VAHPVAATHFLRLIRRKSFNCKDAVPWSLARTGHAVKILATRKYHDKSAEFPSPDIA